MTSEMTSQSEPGLDRVQHFRRRFAPPTFYLVHQAAAAEFSATRGCRCGRGPRGAADTGRGEGWPKWRFVALWLGSLSTFGRSAGPPATPGFDQPRVLNKEP